MTETASVVVMLTAGLLFGVIASLAARVHRSRTAAPSTAVAKESSHAVQRAPAPRSAGLFMIAFYGLLLMLIAVVYLAPIRMIWWLFISAIFAGANIIAVPNWLRIAEDFAKKLR
jgi:hypothetical protein